MNERTLSELLTEVGIRHEPSDIEGKRDLYGADGVHIGAFDAHEAFGYLRALSPTLWPTDLALAPPPPPY